MSIEQEMIKMQIIEDIKKIILGATIEPNMTETRNALIEKCNAVGLNFEKIEEQCKVEMPQRRTYSEIIEDTQINGIERGLYLAFETLLKGEELDTRKLDDQCGREPYSNGFSQGHRDRCRMDVLRALCISLKDSTVGYNLNGIVDLNNFLKEKGINHNLHITKEQLDYVHSLNLDELEEFRKSVDLTLLPQKLYESTDIWRTMDKRGDEYDYLYEKNEKNSYRIYINLHEKSDNADTFLTDYMKMCINRKIPFSMKGHQGKGENSKDNTVLYISEERLLDYLQILDDLSVLHPDAIASFGEPPLLTQKLRSRLQSIPEGWFGFADLGQDVPGTYNDRTRCSCLNAFIAAMYSVLPYKTKCKIQENGYSTKGLSKITKFQIDYNEQILRTTGEKIRKAVLLEKAEASKEHLKSPLESDGRLRNNNRKIVEELTALCSEELSEISKNPNKKQEMFEKFKSYYVLMENYFKYNSPKNRNSSEFSFEDYKGLPTTVSMGLYEKYQQELFNGESQQRMGVKKEKSFTEVFQEAFKDLKINETDTSDAFALLSRTKTEREQAQTELGEK